MPTSMRDRWKAEDLAGARMAGPLPFTNGFPVMKIPRQGRVWENTGPLLFDLKGDPGQEHPVRNARIEDQLLEQATAEARRCEAPVEYFARYGMSVSTHTRQSFASLDFAVPR
jgi:hypothetical protein